MRIKIALSQYIKKLTLLSYVIMGAIPAVHAEFSLNFLPISGQTPTGFLMDCNTGATRTRCERGDALTDPDQTPFYQEIVSDGTYTYYHDIIGDPNSGFAIEYFIRAGSSGIWAGYNESPINASGGTYNGGIDATPSGPESSWETDFVDPLAHSSLSGSGTGNPERVIFRQIVRDAEMEMDVRKTTYANKPIISLIIDDGIMTNTFELDMSGISYNDLNTAGIMLNQLTINDPELPSGGILEFDVTTESQSSNVSGGKYTYTPSVDGNDGSGGIYDYADGIYDVHNVDWSSYWDPNINVPNTN